ncbi:DUF1983 domain-containing protein [Escherichia coli]|nr:DUF1983 domain-containing protein [Escherichia coli]
MSMELMVKAMKIRVGNPLRKLVLIKLADNASDQGECWPSYQHIADQCEISKRSVMNHIAALCESGLVKKVTRKGEKGNSSNIYLLHLDGAGDSLGGSANNSLSGAANSPGSAGVALGGSAGDSPRTSHSFEPVKEPVNEPIAVGASVDESVRVRSNRPEYSPEFEQAWLAYPKRAGGNSKSAAFKAWKARLNEGVNPETMLEGVKRYAGWVSAMGIRTGGRVLAVNSQTRTLTLDREITLPSSGTTLISLVDGQGSPVSVEVQSVTDGVKVKVSRVPDGVAEYSVWGLKLSTLRQRLFRCVSIRENDDGTYAITAVQHVPEKEAIVDNGAHFDGDQSGTVNGVTPPAVQHLTAEVTADSGEYQVLARWDTPKVVKGVSFLLRLTVAADDGRERLVSTARTTETTYRFTQLALGNYRLTVRAVNAWGQQGDPASVSFRIAAPAAPSRIELTPGYFQITATPHLAVYDPTVQFEFWFSEKRIADIRQVETSARYLGTALYWIAASINIKPGHDYYFYVRSVNTVGKSAFVEAVGQPSDDASGYLDFFKGEIGKTHLAQELWTQIDNGQLAPDLTEIRTSITDVSNEITQTVNKKLEDQSAAIQQIQKVQVDTNNNLNSMWAVKLQQMQDGRLYIAGIGAGIENTPDGMQSQVLLAADRIAMINPANGNTKPMFVGQGDQIFMNEVFLKRLTAPTITSGGSPPVFSLTSDGKLTAKNADISGSVNANSGTLNNVTINQNCTIKGMLEATQVRGDFVKAVSKAFPKKVGTWGNTETPNGTVTVTISDDHNFDRQIIIPPIIFNGIAYSDPGSGNNPGGTRYTGYGFEVRKNGVLIASRETKGAIPGSYSAVIDMPSGRGSVTLEFKIFQKGNQGAGNITDCTVIVTKKAASGISIR